MLPRDTDKRNSHSQNVPKTPKNPKNEAPAGKNQPFTTALSSLLDVADTIADAAPNNAPANAIRHAVRRLIFGGGR